MNQSILVEGGRRLVGLMSTQSLDPRPAMWVHDTDADTRRLWIGPPTNVTDKREFYRRLSEIVSDNRGSPRDLDASDVEMVSATHPAIQALSEMFSLTGNRTTVRVQDNMLGGFYLPDGIILQLAL